MKALIAMSGGVDSSVAAKLMLDQGYECVGCTMKLYNNPDAGCSSKSEKTMNPKPVSVRDTVDERSIKPPIKTVLPLEKRDKTPRANPTHSDDVAET